MTSFAQEQFPRLLKTLRDLEDVLAKRVNADNIADGAITTTLLANSAVSQAKIAANSLDATVAGSAADNAPTAGLQLIRCIAVPAGATGDIDIVMTHRERVADCWLVKRTAAGGGAGTVQVKRGADAITNAMSIDVADQTVVACATLNDAFRDIPAGGTLRITRTRTASTDESCDVFLATYRIA